MNNNNNRMGKKLLLFLSLGFYLKFIFYLAGICLWIQSADVVINGSEFTNWDGRVATKAGF